MDSETGFLDKVDVVPLEAALLVLESILQLPLGAANDSKSIRGYCAKASIPFVASGVKKDSMSVLQLRLLRHELKASVRTVELPRPMTEAKLRPELERACTLGLQPEPLPPFVSPARRPHVPSQPKSAPAALATATAALAQSAAPKRRNTSSISRRKVKKLKENVFSSVLGEGSDRL